MALTSRAEIAAALAEQVYRRASQDQALTDGEIGAVAETDLAPAGLKQSDDYFYNDSTGFVGRVVDVGGTVYVVFRGTDMSLGGAVNATPDHGAS